MATDAIVLLNELRCIRESDGSGGSEPYLWPVLIWIDDNTLATPELVGATGPVIGSARVVIKSGMRAGETAAIPASVGVRRVRFEDDLATRRLILAVAMWEHDETPTAAMRDGFRAFQSELQEAIADNLFALASASGQALDDLIAAIEARVRDRVRAAIKDGLSWWQKARVVAGTLNLDDIVGSQFVSFETLAAGPLNLTFRSGDDNEYRVEGNLRVQPVVVDPCQAQIDAVREAQRGVDAVDASIRSLQEELGSAPPGMKPGLIALIRKMQEEDLPGAMVALEAANQALQRCRIRTMGLPRDAIRDMVVAGDTGSGDNGAPARDLAPTNRGTISQ